MARSTYVYTVQRFERVVAAFTVKRELVQWLEKAALEPMRLMGVQVTRVRDGGREPLLNTILDVTGLLEGE